MLYGMQYGEGIVRYGVRHWEGHGKGLLTRGPVQAAVPYGAEQAAVRHAVSSFQHRVCFVSRGRFALYFGSNVTAFCGGPNTLSGALRVRDH